MAASRKLQAEIDRCLKKVSEGVDTFDDIWKKVHNATNNNQKEKYEADLKKEIKKLQRLRDQIKSWIASGEIKDKSQLLEYRKLIETQMERFKVVERETKTKAYSKEGLGAAQKLDPAQKEREEISSWLVTSIDALNLQTNKIEFELEHLSGGKKKKLDKDKQERSDELKNRLERHRFHIQKLESLLRMLDNLSVEVNQIKKIKDDVEYYIESSLEPGFQENEYIYDEISGLDDMEVTGVLQSANDSNHDNETPISSNSVVSPAPSPSHSVTLSNHSNDVIVNSSDSVSEKRKKDDLPKLIKPIPIKASNTNSISNTLVNNYNHHPSFNKQSQHITNNASNAAMMQSSTVTTSVPTFSSTSFSSTLLTSTIPSSGQLSTSTTTQALLLTSITSGPISTSTPVPLSILSSKFNQNSNTITSNSVSHTNSYHNSTTGQGISNFAAVAAANTAQSSKYSILENGPVSLANNSSNNNNNLINSNCINMNINSNSSHLASNTNLLNQQNSNVYSMNFSSLSHSNSQNSQQSSSRTLSTSTSNISNISLMNGPISNSSTLKHPLVSSAFTVKDDKMTSLKSIAQQAIDRAGIEISTFTTSNIKSNNTSSNSSSSIVVNNTNNSGTNKQNDPTKTILNSTATSVICSNQASNSVSSISTKFDTSANNISATSISTNNNKDTTTQLTETFIRPILGVAPLATEILPPEKHQLQLIESASCHMPIYVDSEQHNAPLFQRAPCSVPDYYIQFQYGHMDTAEYYQRLAPETLFFIFYFMEGTKAQFFAAKALKKLSWRFHTKYMMWFQRHEEPKCINDDYEQGTYIYFDYEKWAQRRKDGFTFEYKYLEDRDLN